jgi:fermentation-respiration switch protein FrsA (DUF1100 family)
MGLLAFSVAAVLALIAVSVQIIESRLTFVPPRYPQGFDVLPQSAEAEELWITTSDGVRLNGWYRPHPLSSQVLVWFHGNAENTGQGLVLLPVFARLGVNVLEVDYRGYGKSSGSPSEWGLYCDADAIYDYLIHQRNFRPTDLILYGHSLGGAVAVDLASRRECGGLIVQSSFTSLPDMARRLFPIPFVGLAIRGRFNSIQKIQQVKAPVLVAHGTNDEAVPFWMGRKLYDTAPPPKRWIAIDGAGHNDVILAGGEKYVEDLRSFIEASAGRFTESQAQSPR